MSVGAQTVPGSQLKWSVFRDVVDIIQSGDHLVQHQGSGYLENGVIHVPGVGAGLVPVKVFDEGEYLLLHHGIHPFSGEVPEHTFTPCRLSGYPFAA